MSILAKMAVQITADVARFAFGLDAVNKKLSGFEKLAIGVGKTLVGTFAGYAVINGINKAVGVMADFEVQMSTVKAITGATGDEFSKLEKNALDLGKSTRYTATQVGSLQVEYGRLGFSTKEIINATKATLNLATASGSDLARSAEIAGSTLRAFQIDAKEMGRVTDVMSSGFNTSALGLDNFAESIKYVAPVAKAVNVSLEETTAMLAVLADAGIKGSQAGTSLRRIFTQLTADGGPLVQRLAELSNQGITLAGANDEVGLYAQTALLVLGNQNDRVKELTETYKNANGETQRMADIMEDNLMGSVTKLSSAWEGLILNFKNSNGFLRAVIDRLTEIVNTFSGDQMTRFNSLFLGVQNSISLGNGVRGTQLMNLIALAKDLQIELSILKDSAGNITGIEKLVRGGSVGPNASKSDILSIGSEAFAKAQANNAVQIENIASLTEKLNLLQTDQLTLTGKQLMITNQEIKATEEKIKKLRELGVAIKSNDAARAKERAQAAGGFTASVAGFDTSKIKFAGGIDGIANIQSAIAKATQIANDKQLEQIEIIKEQRNQWVQLGMAASDSISQSIGSAQTLGQTLAKLTATIINQLEQITLARMAANSAKFGIGGILAAAAGFGIVKGIFNRISKEGSQSTYSSPAYAKSQFVFRQRGTDLVGVVNETNRMGTRTRG